MNKVGEGLIVRCMIHEIERLRAELESERACGVESMAMYRRARDERDALLALLRDAREQVDMVGCSQEGYDEMCRERDAMLERIDAALTVWGLHPGSVGNSQHG